MLKNTNIDLDLTAAFGSKNIPAYSSGLNLIEHIWNYKNYWKLKKNWF